MDSETKKLFEELNNKLERIIRPKFWQAFLNGMVTGLGTVIGATLLLAIILSLLSRFATVPVVGNYIKSIVEVVQAPKK